MKSFIFGLAVIAISSSAFADAETPAAITCKSKNGVTLEEKIPYVSNPEGTAEIPPSSYVLTVKGKKTTFADSELDYDVDKYGFIYTSGIKKNNRSFLAYLSPFKQDEEELNVVEERATGTLHYRVGDWERTVKVDCVRE